MRSIEESRPCPGPSVPLVTVLDEGCAPRERPARARTDAYRDATLSAGDHRNIACLKRWSLQLGVVSSAALASGTPCLDSVQAERHDAAFAAVLELARESAGEAWLTRTTESATGISA